MVEQLANHEAKHQAYRNLVERTKIRYMINECRVDDSLLVLIADNICEAAYDDAVRKGWTEKHLDAADEQGYQESEAELQRLQEENKLNDYLNLLTQEELVLREILSHPQSFVLK